MAPFLARLGNGGGSVAGFGFRDKRSRGPKSDLTVPAAVNAPGEWTFATDGNLVLTTPGTYNITFNKTLSKTVKMWGGGGGGTSGFTNRNTYGGGAGAASGTVNFTAGPYTFVVGTRGIRMDGTGGAIPGYGSGGISNPKPGGVNWSTPSQIYGGSGGGGTGIHNGVEAILVAGGGGGGAEGVGGAGGGTNGGVGSGSIYGGGGGTSTTPGSAGYSDPDNALTPMSAASAGGTFNVLTGSNGGNSSGNQPYISAGGGGGGWRGGGGGGNHYGVGHGAGGGGSGYSNPSFVTSATLYSGGTDGIATAAGNNTDPLYSPTYGYGGASRAASAPQSAGGNGAIIVVA